MTQEHRWGCKRCSSKGAEMSRVRSERQKANDRHRALWISTTWQARSSLHTISLYAVVFFQQFAQALVRESIDMMIIATRHALICDERVNDPFFGRLSNRIKDRIEPVVGHRFD